MKPANDPVIDEIRDARHRISEKCGHDPERLVRYYLSLQERDRSRLIEAPEHAEKEDGPAA